MCTKNRFEEGEILVDGRYRIHSLLNHGSFGTVYLVNDTVTGDNVALKCLSKASAARDCSRTDVDENSVELACHDGLGHHPNIVNLIRTIDTDAHIFLILEYCAMGDLYEAIKFGRGPLETENVREFMLQLVSAVEYMHSKGFCHRDIKPENIFLAADGSVKLGDLGLATTDAWSHEASVGSDRYMAPEQYDPSESGYAPAKADIWAIGICLLNVLFSRNPFVTPTESDVLFADFTRDNQSLFDIFPNMSQDTFDVLIHAMAIDPSRRSLSAVRQALENVVSFTTDDEVGDDFCTGAPQIAPASANREPLRTPSFSSPQLDDIGAFPWARQLHGRQLSVIEDANESIKDDNDALSEDLFSSERARDSFVSLVQNSSTTSGFDSMTGTSYISMTNTHLPATRNLQRSRPVHTLSSLPARMSTLSSIFGKKDKSISKSWTDIWDEDEEEESVKHEEALNRRHELNSRSFSKDGRDYDPTLRVGLSEMKESTTNTRTQSPQKDSHRASVDNLSDNLHFSMEDLAHHHSPPLKRMESPLSKRTMKDKWAALGNRRRQYHQGTDASPEVDRKRSNTGNWRAGFGLKVFSGNGGWGNGGWGNGGWATYGWDKDTRKPIANANKILDWRRDTHAQHKSREDLGIDFEWVGA